MKTAFFLATVLAILTSPLTAQIVESNLTVALKFHVNNTDPVTKGDSMSQTYRTVTLKTLDLIDAFGYAYYNTEAPYFLASARLIRQDAVNNDGTVASTRIFIRDKVRGDVEITDKFTFATFMNVAKYKYSVSKGTGTYNAIATSSFKYLVNDEDTDSEEIEASGIDRFAIRTVLLRNNSLVDLEALTSTINGYAFFYAPGTGGWFEGVVEGTVKVSGARVVAAP